MAEREVVVGDYVRAFGLEGKVEKLGVFIRTPVSSFWSDVEYVRKAEAPTTRIDIPENLIDPVLALLKGILEGDFYEVEDDDLREVETLLKLAKAKAQHGS